jgi:hypothetical protein
MVRIRQYIVGIILVVAVSSCTQRMICPAYQSAFIHDKATLDRKFSYFGEDSMPKILEASKDRHLLIDPVTYRKRMRSLQTVEMKDIYPQKPDSLLFDDEFALAERETKSGDLYDSAALVAERPSEPGALASASDSGVYVISIKKEKFNIDQELYLWYLKDYLVYPDVKLQMEQDAENNKALQKESGEKKGFFKRLFGKKNKSDSTKFDIETSATGLDDGITKKKKFGLFKKKDKKKKEPKEKEMPDDPANTPSNDEDDGEEDF